MFHIFDLFYFGIVSSTAQVVDSMSTNTELRKTSLESCIEFALAVFNVTCYMKDSLVHTLCHVLYAFAPTNLFLRIPQNLISLPMFIKTQSKKKCKAVSECLQSVQENVVVAFEALKRHFLSCGPAGEVTCLAMKELKKHY